MDDLVLTCVYCVYCIHICAHSGMYMVTHRTWRKSRLLKRRCVKRCCKYRYYRLLHICGRSSRAGGGRGGRKSGVAGMLRVWRKRGRVPSLCALGFFFSVPISIRSESLFLFARLSLSFLFPNQNNIAALLKLSVEGGAAGEVGAGVGGATPRSARNLRSLMSLAPLPQPR